MMEVRKYLGCVVGAIGECLGCPGLAGGWRGSSGSNGSADLVSFAVAALAAAKKLGQTIKKQGYNRPKQCTTIPSFNGLHKICLFEFEGNVSDQKMGSIMCTNVHSNHRQSI